MAPENPPQGRTNRKGTAQHKKRYLRTAVDQAQKLHVLSLVAEHGMASAIRIAFPDLTPHQQKLKQRQVHRWRHASAAIEKAVADGKGRRMKIRAHGVGTVLPREAEEQIAMWIADLRREGVPVSLMMLTFKAQEMAIASGIAAEEFSASSSWKKRFPATFRLSLRRKTRIGQIAPSDAEKVCRDFRLKVLATIEHHKIVQVFNADQTAMNYEFLPSTTINETGSKTVWVRNSGAEKKRLTVMLLADSRGHKLTPFVILKQAPSKVPKTQAFNQQQQNGFGRGVWREVAPLIEKYGFRIYGNTKAWRNSGLSLEFLKFHFGSRDNVGESVLLIWDDFSAHWTAEVLAYAASINVVLIKVPPGYTSSCQPADVAWMKPFKLALRAQWVASLQHQLQQHGQQDNQATFALKAPSRTMLMQWLDSAWEGLPTTTVASGFRRVMFSSDNRAVTDEQLSSADRSTEELVEKLKGLNVAHDVADLAEYD